MDAIERYFFQNNINPKTPPLPWWEGIKGRGSNIHNHPHPHPPPSRGRESLTF
jgi:hypothetical protein